MATLPTDNNVRNMIRCTMWYKQDSLYSLDVLLSATQGVPFTVPWQCAIACGQGYDAIMEMLLIVSCLHAQGLEAVKPPITDVGTAKPSDFTFSSSTSTGTGAASKPSDGAAGNQEAYKGEMEPLVKKAFPDELDHIKPKEAPVSAFTCRNQSSVS